MPKSTKSIVNFVFRAQNRNIFAKIRLKNKKTSKATKNEVVVPKELLDAVKLIQKYKIDEDKKSKTSEKDEKDKKPRKKRVSKRRPKKEGDEVVASAGVAKVEDAPEAAVAA